MFPGWGMPQAGQTAMPQLPQTAQTAQAANPWAQPQQAAAAPAAAPAATASSLPLAAGLGSMAGIGSMPMGSLPMAGSYGSSYGTAQQANPMASMMNPAMQALYQQYAMRWAAFQKLAAGGGMGMNPMMGGMMGAMGGMMGDMSGAAGGAAGAGGPAAEGGIYFKTRICNKWKEGLCPFSETCKYAHGESDLRTVADNERAQQIGAGGQQVDKRGMINMMKKTRLCQEFMTTSMCKYGDKCTFAHGHHELRAPNPAGAAATSTGGMRSKTGQQGGNKDMRKTRLCEKFMTTGQCGYGDGCTFAHGLHDMRRPDDPLPPSLLNRPNPSAAKAAAGGVTPITPLEQQQQQELQQVYGAADVGGVTDGGLTAVGGKRRLDETELTTVDGTLKRQHLEEESADGVQCHLCAELVKQGRSKVLNGINSLENPKAQQLGVMILATSQRLDQLWSKCSPAAVLGWMAKTPGLTIMDKIELLRTIVFHAHANQPNSRMPEGGLGLDSQKYVDKGLPPDCADFVYVCMEGKEGAASMGEYFHMLEVCKQLFGINDENYYQVSTAVASIMMGM
ncbi:hypothetical protein DUNSADRAFT_8418 [Dunaliella salina]|uniref:C3H1-type domain-containing protein n=1 Tax=Dunaliella salina TaxID=3046 RepID=A0ABQ7GJJ1_DUNSA|nr:hypothetical protein DUNSADRAFT_8418 [Dunaliella salina]|eukprot:KAF5834777.1 hypothetical protein DUNSADRAFT_8418 [Dunaliella salina]